MKKVFSFRSGVPPIPAKPNFWVKEYCKPSASLPKGPPIAVDAHPAKCHVQVNKCRREEATDVFLAANCWRQALCLAGKLGMRRLINFRVSWCWIHTEATPNHRQALPEVLRGRGPFNPTHCPAPDRLLNPFGRGPPKQRPCRAARCNRTGSRSKETGFSTSLRTDSSEGW